MWSPHEGVSPAIFATYRICRLQTKKKRSKRPACHNVVCTDSMDRQIDQREKKTLLLAGKQDRNHEFMRDVNKVVKPERKRRVG